MLETLENREGEEGRRKKVTGVAIGPSWPGPWLLPSDRSGLGEPVKIETGLSPRPPGRSKKMTNEDDSDDDVHVGSQFFSWKRHLSG